MKTGKVARHLNLVEGKRGGGVPMSDSCLLLLRDFRVASDVILLEIRGGEGKGEKRK